MVSGTKDRRRIRRKSKPRTKPLLEPARTVVTMCGGVNALARAIGCSPMQVLRWQWPEDQDGTGGLIPSRRQVEIMAWARSVGIADLRPEHFFPERFR